MANFGLLSTFLQYQQQTYSTHVHCLSFDSSEEVTANHFSLKESVPFDFFVKYLLSYSSSRRTCHF